MITFTLTLFYLLCKIAAAIAGLYLSLNLIQKYLHRQKHHLPPGPRGLPIVGHLSLFNHVNVFDHRDKYGDVSYLRIFGRDFIVLNSVDSIREALTGSETAENFSHRPSSYIKSRLMYSDITTESPSPEWKQLRRITHTVLKQHGEGIVDLEYVINEELAHLADLLATKLDRKVDAAEFIKPFAINVVITLFIGERYEYTNPFLGKIGHCNEIAIMLANPFVDAILRVIPVIEYLPFKLGKLIREMLAIQDEILNNLFHNQKNLNNSERCERKGFVFDFIRIQKKEKWLNDEKIKGVIQDIIGATIGTTTASLSAFFLILFKFPRVQTQIQNEIDKVVGGDRRPNLADRENMPYTRGAILELLRYSSIGPLSLPHMCESDCKIFNYTVPAGAIILPNLFRVHHDETYWDKPWEFNPCRFLDEDGGLIPASHPTRRNLLPFGIGKRACMGEVFAKTRIFLFITHLLQRFTFFSADDIPPSCDPRDYISDLVIRPKPYKLIIERRI